MENKLMFGYLIHLSTHMWGDENMAAQSWYLPKRFEKDNDCDIEVWDRLVAFLGERKINVLLIDVGDGIKYESHPEISAPNAWDKDFLRKKLREIRALGIEPIPKLNFSCCHHGWLKEYGRMVSSSVYYQVCADLIREVCEVFDNPRFFHYGMDEENAAMQRNCDIIQVRQGDLWWNDLFFYFREGEKYGARPWIWADYSWEKPALYFERMPKSVLQSNWYYSTFDNYSPEERSGRVIRTYEILDQKGFEQVLCGSCWNQAGPSNVLQTVAHGKTALSAESVKGYLVAPWRNVNALMEYQLMADAHALYIARKTYYPETL